VTVDLLDRLARKRLESRGYLRAGYSPAPLSVLGLGMIDWPGDDDHDPELYLKYARTSNVVYSCTTIRANMLSGLPLRAYRLGAEPGGRVRSLRDPMTRFGTPPLARVNDAMDVTEVDSGALVDLLRRVNRWWTPRRLVHMTEMSLCLAGQAFWQLDRGEKGTRPPADIYYLKHTRLAPKKDATEIIGGWVLDPNTTSKQPLAPDEVVWIRYPDPSDPDYGALPPLAAARLGADTYAAAMKSNWAIFSNGLAPGGFVLPPENQTWSEEQLDEAQEAWTRKLHGVEKRHRWLFMPEPYTIKENTLTPRDAEFLGGLDFSVEDVARAYGLPIELVGGARRTYQNLENAMRAVWMFTLEPEASMVAAELTEQLVPLFGGEVDFVAFDLSDVTALQEDEAQEAWTRKLHGVEKRHRWLFMPEPYTIVMRGLFERQMTSLIDRMEGRRATPSLSLSDLAEMFDLSRWIREFRTAVRPSLRRIMLDAGGDLFSQAGAPGVFDPEAPAVVRKMIAQSQTFAREVNQTTWDHLRTRIAEGIEQGDDIRAHTQTVRDVFTQFAADDVDGKIGRAEMIARTETARAWGAGSHEAAKQSGVIEGKRWVAALDDRTRPAHMAAHGQEVPLDDPFVVGGEQAEHPAAPGLSAGNAINCRCSVIYTTMKARPDVAIDKTPSGTVVTPLGQ